MTDEVQVVGVYLVPGASDVHLIEVRSATAPHDLDLLQFTQQDPSQPRAGWQVPYLERWLDPSGERVLTEAWALEPPDLSESRLVFFLHFVAFDQPLLTPSGAVALPPATPLPARLATVEYETPD